MACICQLGKHTVIFIINKHTHARTDARTLPYFLDEKTMNSVLSLFNLCMLRFIQILMPAAKVLIENEI